MRGAAVALMAAALAASGTAHAQTKDVVVMRRVLAPPTKKLTGTTPSYYSWQTTPWSQTGACGQQGTETRSVSCVRTDGVTVDDSLCVGNGSGARPVTSQDVVVTQSCGYAWTTGDWNQKASTCGATHLSRDVTCVRSDGVVVPGAACSALPQPPSTETSVDYSGCAFSWSAGDWSDPSTTCGSAVETRTVSCQRSDGNTVGAAACASSGQKPAETQNLTETSGCTAYWSTGDWGATAPACGASTQSRTVTCMSGSGATLADADCTAAGVGTKPAQTRPATSQATCTYFWQPSNWSDPGPSCGDVAETRTFSCIDSSGAAADDSLCTQQKPAATRTAHVVTSCTFAWTAGGFGTAQPACGPSIQTQSVSCTRSDGQTVSNSNCDPASRPASTQAATDYTACTYAWSPGPWSDWTSTCGNATQTRVVTCQRADGATVDDGQCAGVKPQTTQSSYQATGCGYAWVSSPWDVVPACGPTTESRYNSCLRSDGDAVDSSQCAAIGPAPATTADATDHSTCGFAWSVGEWSAPSATCGQAVETRAVNCQRSDGSTVSDDQCGAAGAKPAVTQNTTETTGCTYAWTPNDWGSPAPACGTTTETRTNACMRSDGVAVDASLCTGVQPATTRSVNDYSTCSYVWDVSQWSQAGVCGVSATQTRTVTCRRSNGDGVGDSLCTSSGQGPKPAASQTVTDYSGCSYTWKQVIGPWSSTCSDAATRTNVVTCQRSDGNTVDNEMCDASTMPTTTDTRSVTTSCTYTPVYGTYSTCAAATPGSTSGTQTATIASCTRSDGKTVANSMCSPATSTQSCTPPNTSSQYFRQPASLADPYGRSEQPFSYRTVNNYDASPSSISLTVLTTMCWDAVNKTTASASYCSSLTAGANVYDYVNIPATMVGSLHEVYINQADLVAAMPNSTNVLGTTPSAICANGFVLYVTASGVNSQWKLYCGTPDSPAHYARQALVLEDPSELSGEPTASKSVNTGGSSFALAVKSTICWDTAANTTAPSSKCQYLPSGANVYDLVSLPATYVSDLRQVYVNQADIAAAMPNGTYVVDRGNSSSTISNACKNGLSVSVYVGGTAQAWTLKCGTPDNASHYARQIQYLQDPTSLSGEPASATTVNTSNGATFSMAVRGTICWDTSANTSVADANCQYLPTGANVFDLVSLPATYVTDLREVYINQADLQAAEPHGSNYIYSSSNSSTLISSACAGGMPVNVYAGGARQAWTLRCGTPDSPSHYVRQAQYLQDPNSLSGEPAASRSVNTNSGATFSFAVRGTICWDTAANASASDAKCQYFPTGSNVFDLVPVSATYVTDLHEVYVSQADIQAAEPHGNTVFNSGNSNSTIGGACASGTSMSVNVGGAMQSWTMRCGTPDDPNHYISYTSQLSDPYSYGSGSTINDTGSGKLAMLSTGKSCWDTNTNGIAANTAKCSYLPSQPPSSITVPATWNTSAKTVTVKYSDIRALDPYISNSQLASRTCGSSWVVRTGTTGNYSVVCQ